MRFPLWKVPAGMLGVLFKEPSVVSWLSKPMMRLLGGFVCMCVRVRALVCVCVAAVIILTADLPAYHIAYCRRQM